MCKWMPLKICVLRISVFFVEISKINFIKKRENSSHPHLEVVQLWYHQYTSLENVIVMLRIIWNRVILFISCFPMVINLDIWILCYIKCVEKSHFCLYRLKFSQVKYSENTRWEHDRTLAAVGRKVYWPNLGQIKHQKE